MDHKCLIFYSLDKTLNGVWEGARGLSLLSFLGFLRTRGQEWFSNKKDCRRSGGRGQDPCAWDQRNEYGREKGRHLEGKSQGLAACGDISCSPKTVVQGGNRVGHTGIKKNTKKRKPGKSGGLAFKRSESSPTRGPQNKKDAASTGKDCRGSVTKKNATPSLGDGGAT